MLLVTTLWQSAIKMGFIEELPPEILTMIFKDYLCVKDRMNCRLVCKKLKDTAEAANRTTRSLVLCSSSSFSFLVERGDQREFSELIWNSFNKVTSRCQCESHKAHFHSVNMVIIRDIRLIIPMIYCFPALEVVTFYWWPKHFVKRALNYLPQSIKCLTYYIKVPYTKNREDFEKRNEGIFDRAVLKHSLIRVPWARPRPRNSPILPDDDDDYDFDDDDEYSYIRFHTTQ